MEHSNTLTQDVLSSSVFEIAVEKELNRLVKQRTKMRKPGIRYKRDWYDRFGKNLNKDSIMKEIPLVITKKSNKSSEERGFIIYITTRALKSVQEIRETTYFLDKGWEDVKFVKTLPKGFVVQRKGKRKDKVWRWMNIDLKVVVYKEGGNLLKTTGQHTGILKPIV
jgi:hypothetical protein